VKLLYSASASRLAGFLLILLFASQESSAQKKVSCPDGDHFQIDIKQIQIQYDGSSFAGTLNSLSFLSARLEAAPRKLQEAAVATQQWNEFLKGLATGYNNCAVTRQQYYDGLIRIYPRLKEDATNLDEVRKALSEGHAADEKRLQNLLESYYNNLRHFAQFSGRDIVLERIDALSAQIATDQSKMVQQQATILKRLDELERSNSQVSLATPEQVSAELTDIRKSLLAKADEADAAYRKGYELLDRFRFQEAIPYLREAMSNVQLPDFYLALGRAYAGVPDLEQADRVLREGLTLASREHDQKSEGRLDSRLGILLREKGDLDGALNYAQQALKIDAKVYGPDHPTVAIRNNNIGMILKDKGDLDGALSYTQRALRIDENNYGPEDSRVATYSSNIGQILHEKGKLDEALNYTQRALDIDEEVYGPDHPHVAIDANNIGMILKDKGDLDGALSYTQRALKIDEKVYGSDHPKVAVFANNIGQVLELKGDLDGALNYAQRALKIDEKVYGPDHPTVAIDANNIGSIFREKGDLKEALTYAQRALKIDEKIYGPNHPKVGISAHNVGMILYDQGQLDEALKYTQRALKILQESYGPDNPLTKNAATDLEDIKQANQH
jgi:tetratricopeptide (TPR) repeat protein